MDHAAIVRGLERLCDLASDWQRLIDRDRPGRDAIGERRPVDQLHDERVDAVLFDNPVDRGDVRVIERRENFGFALKSREMIGVAGAPGVASSLSATWRSAACPSRDTPRPWRPRRLARQFRTGRGEQASSHNCKFPFVNCLSPRR
jgi:hypothetical protein